MKEKDPIKTLFEQAGFDEVKFTDSTPPKDLENYPLWLGQNYHGTMDYLSRNQEIRKDIQKLLPGVKSVILLAKNYYQEGESRPSGDTPGISKYAWGKDYHRVLKRLLKKVILQLKENYPEEKFRSTVDTAPILERAWGKKGGLGFQGKNTLLIHPQKGSFFFIASVLTTLPLKGDSPLKVSCGNCTACLDACPTQAFPQPYVLDSRKCISYQTIENRREGPSEIPSHGYLFGCDICQEVCPWNKFSTPTEDKEFKPREGLFKKLQDLENFSREDYQNWISDSPMNRMTYFQFKRNLENLK